MKKLSLAAMCCIATSAYAQNQNLDFKYGLKLSNSSSYEKTIEDNSFYSEKSIEVFHPSVSFLINTKNNNFHEFELTDLSLNSKKYEDSYYNPGYHINTKFVTSHIGIQYQYIFNFLKKQNTRWMPSIGLGAKSEFIGMHSEYDISNSFPSSTYTFSFTGMVTPAINYNISKRFFASFSIPVYIFNTSTIISKQTDPNLTRDEQSSSINNFNAFPSHFGFKLGIGIKL